MSDPNLSALLEAIIYLADEPVRLEQIQKALPEYSRQDVSEQLAALVERFQSQEHGIEIREVADGYRFSTKPEHHEVLKKFAKSLVRADAAVTGGVGNTRSDRLPGADHDSRDSGDSWGSRQRRHQDPAR